MHILLFDSKSTIEITGHEKPSSAYPEIFYCHLHVKEKNILTEL